MANAKKLRHRFNMMLDDQMVGFLEKKSVEMKVSKADLVRKLIEQRMNSN